MSQPLSGQIVTSGTPQVLTATVLTPVFWMLKAPLTNVAAIYFGNSAVAVGTGFPLLPGEALEFDLRIFAGGRFDVTPNDIYVVGAGGTAAWLAFR